MTPAKTDAQNATVSAINGTEAAMVAELDGCLARIEFAPAPLTYSVLCLGSGGDRLNPRYNEILKGRGLWATGAR